MEHTLLKLGQGIFLALAILISLWDMLVSNEASDLRSAATDSKTVQQRGGRRWKLYGAICLWISALCWILQLVTE